MGLFGKRQAASADSDIAHITALATAQFAASGVPVTIAEGTSGMEVTLLAADGAQYPLYNLITRVRQLPEAERDGAIRQHVSGLVTAMGNPSHSSLDDTAFEAQVRVRLAHTSIAQMLPVTYARPFAADLISVLCLDTPTTVEYVNDETLEGRDVERLYQVGLANTLAEPLIGAEEVAPGVIVVEGESFFTASKAVDFAQMLGTVLPPAPLGVVFGVPHRHLIIAHVLRDAASIQTIGQVAQLTAIQAGPEAPGGPLSASIFFWRDGTVEAAGEVGEAGGIEIRPGERFLAALETLSAT